MKTPTQWLILAVVLMGTFMAILDVAIVNVAIPSIRSDLNASFGEVELVISAYTLTYACLLITGGRLGDLYGRKNLFIVGLFVFGAASALCGAAPSAWVLIAARAVQGVGGALMYPQVLAIIQVTFSGEDRGKALGIFGCVIGVAAIAGQILGGALLAVDIWGLTWRPIFLINVPQYLMREALAYGNQAVPHESERVPVISAQVEEARRRQAEGLLPKDMDPAMLRLFGFALVSYPRLLPQVTRMTTAMSPGDPKFVAAWEDLLHRIGNLLEREARRVRDQAAE